MREMNHISHIKKSPYRLFVAVWWSWYVSFPNAEYWTVNECHSMAMTVDSTRRIHQNFIWVYSLFDSNILCPDHRLFVDAWQKYILNSVVCFGVRMVQFYIQSCRLSNMDVQCFLCTYKHKHWQLHRELAVLSINECHVPPTSDVLKVCP